jgi:hypothetical protein
MSARYEIIDVEQGTPEWHEARRGIPTASRFADVLAQGEGKMRTKYLRQLAGEIVTEEVMADYSNERMKDGKEKFEPILRKQYEFDNAIDTTRIGFVRMNPELCRCGCSPDGWIGDQGMVEFKSAEPHILIEMLETKRFPSEHTAQVQGNLYISKRKWCDLVIGWPKLPLYVVRVQRDEDFIARLSVGLKAFNKELDALVERLRNY